MVSVDLTPPDTGLTAQPPKKGSDIQHITFHFYRSAILLSVSQRTYVKRVCLTSHRTIDELKEQLVVALLPFQGICPVPIPVRVSDIGLFEEPAMVEGAESPPRPKLLRDATGKTIKDLGWDNWKKVYLR
jgi:hypothetical protein